jgi:hypothetical protein
MEFEVWWRTPDRDGPIKAGNHALFALSFERTAGLSV